MAGKNNRSKSKKRKQQKKSSYFFPVIAVIVLVAFVFLMVYNPVKRNKKVTGNSKYTEQFIKKINETPLRNDASLAFIRSPEQDTLAQIDVQVVDHETERMQGLMYRKQIGNKEGMLFIFERSEPRSFWMKNTFISLDIFYIDEDHAIVSIRKYTKPLSTHPIPSGKPAKFVVETNAGFADKYGIREGDRISFPQ